MPDGFGETARRPRVLFVSRASYGFPLPPREARRWDALSAVCEPRVLGVAGSPGSAGTRAHLRLWHRRHRLDSAAYYSLLSPRLARELLGFQPEIAVVQGSLDAALLVIVRSLVRARTKIVLDVQGDWRAASRLYGSRARALLSAFDDRAALFAIRRADAVRVLSAYTASLVSEVGRTASAVFPPLSDSATFLDREVAPLPEVPTVLFVGVLEQVKGIDVLLQAWPHVEREVPSARLHVVGSGALESQVRRAISSGLRISWSPRLDAEGVANALDASTLLCFPSRSEGLGRVAFEAMGRGRAVVGSRTGGIPDVVQEGLTGSLVEPGDAGALAHALIEVLTGPEDAEAMGRRGRAAAGDWLLTPEEFAARYARLFRELAP